ncbi:MAG: cbb3-type cytochrome c oxidase subunit II [Luteolibacter sp.]
MRWLAVRAAVVVAAVYGYFLIFAQFSFVELLRSGGATLMQEKIALGAMAVTGMAAGFFAAWRGASPRMVRGALALAALSAAAAPYWNSMPGALVVGVATGAALGMATVGLAALVPAWCGVAWVGLGTGLGYALCNFPAIFTQPPTGQAWVGVSFALIGMLAVPSATEWRVKEVVRIFPLWGALALFTALVWMDSAAFFIIQHSDDLKSGTWGDGLLWRNAAVHLSVAIVAGLWLARGGARVLPALAWVLLAVAALAVNHETTRDYTGWFYPAAVSLYSTALVAWPGWFSGAGDSREAGWRAAWLFAIAGWFGSANGIGMAQTLQTVPPVFVAGAGAVVIGVMVFSDLKRWKSAAAVGAVILAGTLVPKSESPSRGDAAGRGRQVYLAEGCIHCHSQYIRPGSLDEENWGPVRKVEDVLKGEPVLIGNRRQGPDLTNIGARRSEAWLKIHFINPQLLAPGSAMPSYAHLFDSGKGDDLVRYLKQSGVDHMSDVMAKASAWKPTGTAAGDGKKLFTTHCAACHGSNGLGNGPVSLDLPRKPANLVAGPFVWTPPSETLDLRIAQIIKFGLPVTDMPGHETLTDEDILALRDHVLKLRRKP